MGNIFHPYYSPWGDIQLYVCMFLGISQFLKFPQALLVGKSACYDQSCDIYCISVCEQFSDTLQSPSVLYDSIFLKSVRVHPDHGSLEIRKWLLNCLIFQDLVVSKLPYKDMNSETCNAKQWM